MSIQAFLAKQAPEIDSVGHFTLEPTKAREKMRQQVRTFSFRNTLRIMQWAIGSGPEQVNVHVYRSAISIDFETAEPVLPIEQFQRCLENPLELEEGPLKDLGFAILGVEGFRSVQIQVTGPNVGYSYDCSPSRLKSQSKHQGAYKYSVTLGAPESGNSAIHLDHRSIEQSCRYSSVKVMINGKSIQSCGSGSLVGSASGSGGVYNNGDQPRVGRTFRLSARKPSSKILFLKRGVVVDTLTDFVEEIPCRGTVVVDASELKTDLSGFKIMRDEKLANEVSLAKKGLVSLVFRLRERCRTDKQFLHDLSRKGRFKYYARSLAKNLTLGHYHPSEDQGKLPIWRPAQIPDSVEEFCRKNGLNLRLS